MEEVKKIELLAPAKNAEIGIEAIRHGADAVYIGAPQFGARAAAGNTLSDIDELVKYAHLYKSRVYIALNTILKDSELQEASSLIASLYNMGADALIVQDMALLQLDLPPIALHASTQMDNRTPEKVRFLQEVGFSQVVLARELSTRQIAEIAQHTTVPLEVFVHGALCVSYSGQCYISECLAGRSANRGACAQYCRLPYTLVDADGNEISRNKHLLSLKDMNRSGRLENMLDAGVTSFKIEGRLKDMTYVKNITAYYRQQLDKILARRPQFTRSSSGTSIHSFVPQPEKSFNRGFTSYFIDNRREDITSFDTPKSLGEYVGTVKSLTNNYLVVAGIKSFNNGDGFMYENTNGEYTGFRINRADENKLYPSDMPRIAPKTALYRNHDQEFEKQLSNPSAQRLIEVDMQLRPTAIGFCLQLRDEDNHEVIVSETIEKEFARADQGDNQNRQLSKLGNTPFLLKSLTNEANAYFIASSQLATWRREAIETLILVRMEAYKPVERKKIENKPPYFVDKLTYLGNVANEVARVFYQEHGVKEIEPAYEINKLQNVPLMFTKHCILQSLGLCLKKKKNDNKEPFYLVGRDFKLLLSFDCVACEMKIFNTHIEQYP